MRAPSRKYVISGVLVALMITAFVASSLPVQSRPEGIDSSSGGAGTGAARGCTCHSPTQNGNANISFVMEGLPGGYYQAAKKYTVHLSFVDTEVPMNNNSTANHGGFNVWTSAGLFSLNANSSRDVEGDAALEPLVALQDGGQSISHSKFGDVYGNRSWTFDWTAPAANNNSNIMFDILVNAVNGDGASTGDHWTRAYEVRPGLPGASTGAVDISKLGVPLRAYWLGVIGILSTMFLMVLSFYVIRSGSKFYEFGLPRGQVKSVKIRTIPPPRNKGAYAVMTGLIVIAIVIVVTFMSISDQQLDALRASVFLLSFMAVIALAAVYYIRAFLPIVDVLEEETIEPLR